MCPDLCAAGPADIKRVEENLWAVNVLKAVGNYGEVFDRSLKPIGIQRGPNALWTTTGGLQYSPPFR